MATLAWTRDARAAIAISAAGSRSVDLEIGFWRLRIDPSGSGSNYLSAKLWNNNALNSIEYSQVRSDISYYSMGQGNGVGTTCGYQIGGAYTLTTSTSGTATWGGKLVHFDRLDVLPESSWTVTAAIQEDGRVQIVVPQLAGGMPAPVGASLVRRTFDGAAWGPDVVVVAEGMVTEVMVDAGPFTRGQVYGWFLKQPTGDLSSVTLTYGSKVAGAFVWDGARWADLRANGAVWDGTQWVRP